MSDLVYSAYIIPFEEVRKVVPDEVRVFEEKAEKILVFLKLTYTDYGFTMEDIFEFCTRDDIEGCRIYNILDNGDFHSLDGELDDIYSSLCLSENSVFGAFKKKTNIGLGAEYNYKEEQPYFYLHEDDLIQLTPSGKALRDNGVSFEFANWSEGY